MQQTFIVTTHTTIDVLKLQHIIVHEWQKANFALPIALKTIATDTYQLPNLLDESAFSALQAGGQIITKNYDSKREFRTELLSLYAQYNQPTIAFLGDIDSYDERLQEGMLKLLEEPPQNMLIVLTAQSVATILPTIVSRAQIISLPQKTVFGLLSPDLKKSTEKHLGKAEDTAKKLLRGESLKSWIDGLDLKKVERHELSFWLWMLSVCLQTFYTNPAMTSSQPLIATLLQSSVQARVYNDANVQKKMVLYSLMSGQVDNP